jgi:hypothetical protein
MLGCTGLAGAWLKERARCYRRAAKKDWSRELASSASTPGVTAT